MDKVEASAKYQVIFDKEKLPQKIQSYLDDILKKCREYLFKFDEDLIIKAVILCYHAHKNDVRASGSPYYTHPFEVALIVIKEFQIDDIAVAASLLHDTVEDTDLTIEDIKYYFDDTIADIVNGVTKIAHVTSSENMEQGGSFMKMLVSMAKDLRVILIKFADRVHNLRTLKYLSRVKQLRIAQETLTIYAPMAHRFGLYRIKNEMEDLSMKVINPSMYKMIAHKLNAKKDLRDIFIHHFIKPVEERLKELGYNFVIKGRPKHIYSIYRKMKLQQKAFEDIYDLFAIRIILDNNHTKEDCWRVCSIITDWYIPIPERFRDFISVPKANGYQSLHTTVITKRGERVEVQIRTKKMDDMAEYGLSAHWRYKESIMGSDQFNRCSSWVSDILSHHQPDMVDEFMKDFKLNFFENEVYVFSPKGQLFTLPKGSTCLDFAFAIHGEVGKHASSSKINDKLSPLRTILKTGDIIQIITSNKANINGDWLSFVKTHKALHAIRQHIRYKRKHVAQMGREKFNKLLDKNKVSVDDHILLKIASKLKYSNINELFYDVGSGYIDAKKVYKEVHQYLQKAKLRKQIENKETPKPVSKEKQVKHEAVKDVLVVDNSLTDVYFVYANCCQPVPGDEVLGYISRNGGIKVHRSNCHNLMRLLANDSNRVSEIQWGNSTENKHIVKVNIVGKDRLGLVNDIANMLSKFLKVDIKDINISTKGGGFTGIISLYVSDTKQLDVIISKIKTIDNVEQVFRHIS